jgi:Family of unknown function (DUF5681)
MNTSSKPEDVVGYGRPPKRSRWKKGQCGNPNRIRNRSPKPAATMIDEFFAHEVDVIENGVALRRTAFEIIYLQLCNTAIAGSTRALNVLIKYADFAASRAPDGGLEVVVVDKNGNPIKSKEKNG